MGELKTIRTKQQEKTKLTMSNQAPHVGVPMEGMSQRHKPPKRRNQDSQAKATKDKRKQRKQTASKAKGKTIKKPNEGNESQTKATKAKRVTNESNECQPKTTNVEPGPRWREPMEGRSKETQTLHVKIGTFEGMHMRIFPGQQHVMYLTAHNVGTLSGVIW